MMSLELVQPISFGIYTTLSHPNMSDSLDVLDLVDLVESNVVLRNALKCFVRVLHQFRKSNLYLRALMD